MTKLYRDIIEVHLRDNAKLESFMYHDRRPNENPWHNAHYRIIFRAGSGVNCENFLAECLALPGVVKEGAKAEHMGIVFGSKEPAVPFEVADMVLELLQKKGLVSKPEAAKIQNKIYATKNEITR